MTEYVNGIIVLISALAAIGVLTGGGIAYVYYIWTQYHRD